MRILESHYTSPSIALSAGSIECIEEGQLSAGSFGDISQGGKLGWIVRGGALEVVSVTTGCRLAAWSFGRSNKDEKTLVTCVVEYTNDNGITLLVGLETDNNMGMVCVFDVKTSKVMKAVEIPYKVTCLEAVYNVGDNESPTPALSEHLRCFMGIVAVGTQYGYVYLLDLCLDDVTDESDEVSPNEISVLDPRMRDIPRRRQDAMRKGQHLCLCLDSENHCHDMYRYKKPDGTVIQTFTADEVAVSSLKYIKQLGSLIVGFNFGTVQIWRLYNPVLDYSSRYGPSLNPVTHITYQEPENDPRNFCYIWVVRGPLADQSEGETSIELFQLAYNKKVWHDGYGILYEDLTSVGPRFDHILCDNPEATIDTADTLPSSRLISCYTIEDTNYQMPIRNIHEDSFEDGCSGPDLSLCVFIWEVLPVDSQSKSQCLLGLFDINRWYHAQMPMSMRFSVMIQEQCPFFSYCSLEDVVKTSSPDCILAAHVDWEMLSKYVSMIVPPPEQHYFPASLSFNVTCLTETSVVTSQFLGLQRHVLAELSHQGPAGLIQPQDLFSLCVFAGLLHRHTDSSSSNVQLNTQREALLSVALEHNMVNFISSCVLRWSHSEAGHAGCTLRFLLEWAWNKVASIKRAVDKLCIPLYDCSGLALDQQSLQLLHSYVIQLSHMVTLFQTFNSPSVPMTSQGIEDMKVKLNVVTLLHQHVKAVSWFVTAGLLPEVSEGYDVVEGSYFYPAQEISKAFRDRRESIQRLHSELDSTNFLLIDGLVNSTGDSIKNIWNKDNGLYPPSSLHALLNLYLLDGVDDNTKHMIVAYLLMDILCLAKEDQREAFEEKVNQFYQTFAVSQSISHLIQGFWQLDHNNFEDALVEFLDPMIQSHLESWQHSSIVKGFLYHGHQKMALKYIHTKKPKLSSAEEVRLNLTVILANGMTSEAFEYQRVCRDQSNIDSILPHFFVGSQQTNTVDKLLQLPLSEEEESHLVNYLMTTTEPHSMEVLILHYLQRSRYVEAIRLNEKLKHSLMGEVSSVARSRAAARNAIIQGYTQVLPSVQRKLAFGSSRQARRVITSRREVTRPKPLSSVVNRGKQGRLVSHSTLINAVLDRVDEARRVHDDECTPFKRKKNEHNLEDLGPFICTPLVSKVQSRISDNVDVVFPNTSPVEKKSLPPSSPLKRFLGFSPAFTQQGSPERRKSHKLFTAEALSLLQTPPVHKKTPPKWRVSGIAQPTPQSILKVRHVVSRRSPSPPKTMLEPVIARQMKLSSSELAIDTPPRYKTKVSELKKAALPSMKLATPAASPKTIRFATISLDLEPSPQEAPCFPEAPLRSVRDRSPSPDPTSLRLSPGVDQLHELSYNPSSTHEVNEDIDDDITFAFNIDRSRQVSMFEAMEDSGGGDTEPYIVSKKSELSLEDTNMQKYPVKISPKKSPISMEDTNIQKSPIRVSPKKSPVMKSSPKSPIQKNPQKSLSDKLDYESLILSEDVTRATGLDISDSDVIVLDDSTSSSEKVTPKMSSETLPVCQSSPVMQPLVIDASTSTKVPPLSPRRSPRLHSPSKDDSVFKTPPRPTRVPVAMTPPTSPESSPRTQKIGYLKQSPSPISSVRSTSYDSTSAKDESDTVQEVTSSEEDVITCATSIADMPVEAELMSTTEMKQGQVADDVDSSIIMTLRSGRRKSISREPTPTLRDSPLMEFTFAKPTPVRGNTEMLDVTMESAVPSVQSFIFSPPLTRSKQRTTRKIPQSVVDMDSSTSAASPRRPRGRPKTKVKVESSIDTETTMEKEMPRSTKITRQRKKKSVASPRNSPSDSPISFVSPVVSTGVTTRLRSKDKKVTTKPTTLKGPVTRRKTSYRL